MYLKANVIRQDGMDSEPDHDKAQPPSPLAQEAARRRAAETMLAESEARYRSLFDNASDGILLFDDAGVIFKAKSEDEADAGLPPEGSPRT